MSESPYTYDQDLAMISFAQDPAQENEVIDVSFRAIENVKPREKKADFKKSELYQRILREHNMEMPDNRLNYDIKPLPLFGEPIATPTETKTLTRFKPFNFETEKRIEKSAQKTDYEPLPLQVQKAFTLRDS
jgi:hypothetical protein